MVMCVVSARKAPPLTANIVTQSNKFSEAYTMLKLAEINLSITPKKMSLDMHMSVHMRTDFVLELVCCEHGIDLPGGELGVLQLHANGCT